MAERLRILCVATPPELLESRTLVLQWAGYETTFVATLAEVSALREDGFDLLIISATVSKEDRLALRHTVSEDTQVLQLEDFTAPQKLLDLIRTRH